MTICAKVYTKTRHEDLAINIVFIHTHILFFVVDTTDVQMVRVEALEDHTNVITVWCDFITKSNAQGCRVVLVGDFGDLAVNLTRENNTNVINVTHPLFCYYEVFGFDIEYDGSVGTLAVPGVISWNVSESCITSNDHEEEPTQSEVN